MKTMCMIKFWIVAQNTFFPNLGGSGNKTRVYGGCIAGLVNNFLVSSLTMYQSSYLAYLATSKGS